MTETRKIYLQFSGKSGEKCVRTANLPGRILEYKQLKKSQSGPDSNKLSTEVKYRIIGTLLEATCYFAVESEFYHGAQVELDVYYEEAETMTEIKEVYLQFSGKSGEQCVRTASLPGKILDYKELKKSQSGPDSEKLSTNVTYKIIGTLLEATCIFAVESEFNHGAQVKLNAYYEAP